MNKLVLLRKNPDQRLTLIRGVYELEIVKFEVRFLMLEAKNVLGTLSHVDNWHEQLVFRR